MSPGEVGRFRIPQYATPSIEVIFPFEKGNVSTLKKQALQPESAEKESDATSPKLLLPIVLVLGRLGC